MKLWHLTFLMIVVAAAVVAPLHAQLVHLKMESTDGYLLFKSWKAGSPWDRGIGHVTRLEIHYDTHAYWDEDTAPDPTKNFLRFRVAGPEDRIFEFARPLTNLSWTERNMYFFYAGLEGGYSEEIQVILGFAAPLHAEDAFSYPIPPMPDLEAFDSSFFVKGGPSMFPEPEVGEAYGGGGIQGPLTVTFVPVPEPGTYAIGGFLLVLVVLTLRRQKAVLGAGRAP